MDNINLQEQKQVNLHFIDLFDEKIKALSSKINSSKDQLEEVNYRIDKFYTEEEKKASEDYIKITKDKADKIIDYKVSRYKVIISLISLKYEIIRQRLQDSFYTDELEMAEMKIQLFRLQIELKSKYDFLEKLNDRKKVYNKM